MKKYQNKYKCYEERLFDYLLFKKGKANYRELLLEVFDCNQGLMAYYLSENILAVKQEDKGVTLTGVSSTPFLTKQKLVNKKLWKQ